VQFLVVFLRRVSYESKILHPVQIPPLHASADFVVHQSVNVQSLEDLGQPSEGANYFVGESGYCIFSKLAFSA